MGERLKITPFLSALVQGPGKYFFSKDQWQYPAEDFFRCLKVDRFDFSIRAINMDNYALLIRVD